MLPMTNFSLDAERNSSVHGSMHCTVAKILRKLYPVLAAVFEISSKSLLARRRCRDVVEM